MRNLIKPLLAAAAMVLNTGAAQADLGDQLFKLLADDGAFADEFGVSVAMSGSPGDEIALVGAHRHDDNGEFSGSAYLYDVATGQQIDELLPFDGAADDRFGFSVAISDATTIIGAHMDDDNGIDSGSAYLFDITTGTKITKLLADDGAAGDRFGWSVGISGTRAIVGAIRHDDNGTDSGSAYLFNTTTGKQLFKLLPNDGAANDTFGYSVAISGTTAIVGGIRDDENGTDSGSAYLFDTTTGQQIAKLLPKDGAAGDQFGSTVVITATIAIIAADRDDDNGNDSGSAYLFDISDPTNPVEVAKLLPTDGEANERFGFSVATNGATAIFGALLDDDNGFHSGSAYLFDVSNPASPTQIAKLLPDDGVANDIFGASVAISASPGNEVAIIGSPNDDDNGSGSGSAYLFDAAAPGMCPWDLDGSAVVGVSDLLSLLASWGPCKGCPADFDGNGDVGVSDLLALLANWGPCP